MGRLAISQTNDHFVYDGKPFFYLADTVWSAFTSVTLEQWEEFLDYRRAQGFNVLQINILPQWDRRVPDLGIYPFVLTADGQFDFYQLNEAYFLRAQEMIAMAVAKGFVPALVVLWADYVIDNWASNMMPEHVIPDDAVKRYIACVLKYFGAFEPIYMVSGDTNFESERAVSAYMLALEMIKEKYPASIATFHLAKGLSELPDSILNSPMLDFYAYQSGHDSSDQYHAYKLAEAFYHKPVKRPVINAEPCYEGMAYGMLKYGRHNDFDVRRAIWQSLLSGAKAGVTYGAHGIWNWEEDGKDFTRDLTTKTPAEWVPYIRFIQPMHWRDALQLKGAADAGYAKELYEKFDLFDMEPVDIVLTETNEIKVSMSKDGQKVAIYAPYNIEIKLRMQLEGYSWTMIELNNRRQAHPKVLFDEGRTIIKTHCFNDDVLIIGTKAR